MTKTDFILVDFENVQPEMVDALKDPQCHLMVFIGPNQSKIPAPFAMSMQRLGDRAEYLLLENTGKNALDFHIAYYIGHLSAKFPGSNFYVISRDTGFDPLLSYLKGKRFAARRCPGIEDLPFLKRPSISDSEINTAIEELKKRKTNKPKSVETLRSTLHTVFKKEMTEKQMDKLVSQLAHRGVLKIEGTKVTYTLSS